MYRKFTLHQFTQKFQKIFWRSSPEQSLEVYELTTVTYGTTSGPYLAIKSLQQLAMDDGNKYPVGAKSTLRDFYVDDVLTGADTVEECRVLQTQLQSLLAGGGFTLRKWMSNSAAVLSQVERENISKELLDFNNSSDTNRPGNPSTINFCSKSLPLISNTLYQRSAICHQTYQRYSIHWAGYLRSSLLRRCDSKRHGALN